MVRTPGGCGLYEVGSKWVWLIWSGHQVGVACMVWALSRCDLYGAYTRWVWLI